MTEFMIHGILCQVIPEEDMSEVLDVARGDNLQLQVIGNCLLDGQRYLVLCKQSNPNETVDAERPCDLLTPRELQVALMVCQGRGNKQIAHQLRLSEWTISSYLRRIFAKFGVRTRAAMVAKLMSCVPNEQTLEKSDEANPSSSSLG